MKHLIIIITFIIGTVISSPIDNELNKRFFGLMNDQPQIDEPEPDWNASNYKEIKIDAKEIEMKPNELYSKIEDCIQKCMSEVNSDKSYRDNCVAKICDIY